MIGRCLVVSHVSKDGFSSIENGRDALDSSCSSPNCLCLLLLIHTTPPNRFSESSSRPLDNASFYLYNFLYERAFTRLESIAQHNSFVYHTRGCEPLAVITRRRRA